VAIRITDLDTDPDPDRDTGKTCLGGGMNCHSASSLYIFVVLYSRHLLVQLFAAFVSRLHIVFYFTFLLLSVFFVSKINLI